MMDAPVFVHGCSACGATLEATTPEEVRVWDEQHAATGCPAATSAWTPQADSDGILTLESIIGQAVGSGSVCWEPMDGTGVFQDQQASAIVAGAVAAIHALAAGYIAVCREPDALYAHIDGESWVDLEDARKEVEECNLVGDSRWSVGAVIELPNP